MNDRQLRYAHAVWKDRSFSKASHRLRVSQPSLSDQVRLLEHEIGFDLFQRSNRGVEPTLPGRTFLKEVERVVQDFAALKDFAIDLNGKPDTQLRIGVVAGLAPLIAGPIAMRLRRDAPEIKPSIIVASPRRIVRLIENGRIDLGVAVRGGNEATRPGIAVQPLGDVPLVAMAPASDTGPITLEALSAYPLIVNDSAIGFGGAISALFGDTGPMPEIVAHCDDLAGVRAMVAAGLGLSIVPSLLVAIDIPPAVSLRPIMPKVTMHIELLRGIDKLVPRLETQLTRTATLIAAAIAAVGGPTA